MALTALLAAGGAGADKLKVITLSIACLVDGDMIDRRRDAHTRGVRGGVVSGL